MDLADGGEGDASNNPQHVEEGRQIGLSDFPSPRGEEHGDRRGGLEHLDKGHREIQVDDIGADERARVKDANGQYGSAVDARREEDLFPRIEERRRSSENLRGDGSEDEMPACKKNGLVCRC